MYTGVWIFASVAAVVAHPNRVATRVSRGPLEYHVDHPVGVDEEAIGDTKIEYLWSKATNPPDQLVVYLPGGKTVTYNIAAGVNVTIPHGAAHEVLSLDPNSERKMVGPYDVITKRSVGGAGVCVGVEAPVGAQTSGATFTGGTLGYWFVAPIDFQACTIGVKSLGAANTATIARVEIVKFNAGVDPSTTTSASPTFAFTSLSLAFVNIDSEATVSFGIDNMISAGDVIGILGFHNSQQVSFGPSLPTTISLAGTPVTLNGLQLDSSLMSGSAAGQGLYQNNAVPGINRISMFILPAATSSPTLSPTSSPTTSAPTSSPTTSAPTTSPTASPTTSTPTASPTTSSPTASPTTSTPTASPSVSPTTSTPTASPTTSTPTASPTASPTTSAPTNSPSTSSPSVSPTPIQGPTTRAPIPSATSSPTQSPTVSPTVSPTASPTTPCSTFLQTFTVSEPVSSCNPAPVVGDSSPKRPRCRGKGRRRNRNFEDAFEELWGSGSIFAPFTFKDFKEDVNDEATFDGSNWVHSVEIEYKPESPLDHTVFAAAGQALIGSHTVTYCGCTVDITVTDATSEYNQADTGGSSPGSSPGSSRSSSSPKSSSAGSSGMGKTKNRTRRNSCSGQFTASASTGGSAAAATAGTSSQMVGLAMGAVVAVAAVLIVAKRRSRSPVQDEQQQATRENPAFENPANSQLEIPDSSHIY